MRRFTEKERDEIIQKLRDKVSITQIRDEYKTSRHLIKEIIQKQNIDYSKNHLTCNTNQLFVDVSKKFFIENSKYNPSDIKRVLEQFNIFPYRCTKCGIHEWQDEKITLEIDHTNGNNRDNRIENLRYLCPNCHSQTPTFRGRNKNSGVQKVPEQQLIDAYKSEGNIHLALKKCNLAPKGANYKRIKRILVENKLIVNDIT